MWRGLAKIPEEKDEIYTQVLYNITYIIVTSLWNAQIFVSKKYIRS
jgi:hypothetical protein